MMEKLMEKQSEQFFILSSEVLSEDILSGNKRENKAVQKLFVSGFNVKRICLSSQFCALIWREKNISLISSHKYVRKKKEF